MAAALGATPSELLSGSATCTQGHPDRPPNYRWARDMLQVAGRRAGRLTSVSRNSVTQATFAYDGDGNRRSNSNASSQTTTNLNDSRGLSQVLQATTGSNTLTYVPGSVSTTRVRVGTPSGGTCFPTP